MEKKNGEAYEFEFTAAHSHGGLFPIKIQNVSEFDGLKEWGRKNQFAILSDP